MAGLLPRLRNHPLRRVLADFLHVADRERRQYTGDDTAKYLADVLIVARDVHHYETMGDNAPDRSEGSEVLECLTMVED